MGSPWSSSAPIGRSAGEHDVVMHFLPESYSTGARISAIASIALLLLTLLSILGLFIRQRRA